MTVRSDMVNINAANNYANRGVLIWNNRKDRKSGWSVLSLEDNTDMHIWQDRGVYKVVSFSGSKKKVTVSTLTQTQLKEDVSNSYEAAKVIRDKLLQAAINSGAVRLCNGEFMRMHEILLGLGGRYVTRSKTGVETVEFKSKTSYSEKFQYLYPSIRVTFEKRSVEIHVHTSAKAGKTRETKVHSERHPSRVVQRAVAKRKGKAK